MVVVGDRYSLELDEELLPLVRQEGFLLTCSVGPASRQFGFELLGAVPRLIVTPTTLRATHTLFRAFQCRTGVNVSAGNGSSSSGGNNGNNGNGNAMAASVVSDVAASLGTHCLSVVCNAAESQTSILALVKAAGALGWWCHLQGLDSVRSFDAESAGPEEGSCDIYTYMVRDVAWRGVAWRGRGVARGVAWRGAWGGVA